MAKPVENKKEVIRRLRAGRSKLVSFGVDGISLFGSFAKGQQTSKSDVDILVEFVPDKHSFDNFMELSFFLEEIFGRKVELVTPEGLSPHLGPYILQEMERVSITA